MSQFSDGNVTAIREHMTVEMSTSQWASELFPDPLQWGLDDFSSGLSYNEKLSLQAEANALIELGIPENNQRGNKAYQVSLYRESALGVQGTGDGVLDYHPILNRLHLPVITALDLRAAPNKLDRNLLVGELLELPLELILSRIPGVLFEWNERFQLGQKMQAMPDFAGVLGWKKLFCIEAKNWLCPLTLSIRNVDRLIVPQFYRFEDATGLTAADYTRISILAGLVLIPEVEDYLISHHEAVVVSLPAIQPEGPTTEKLRFLDWALREILLNGSKDRFYQLS